MSSLKVRIASDITKTYGFTSNGVLYKGRSRKEQKAAPPGSKMDFFISEQASSSSTLYLDIADLIAEKCNITDPIHMRLLFVAAGNWSLKKIQDDFSMHGISVPLRDTGKTRPAPLNAKEMLTSPG